MPSEVEILAIEAADTCTIFEGLTPAVEAAVVPLSREIYEDLKRRAPPTSPRTARTSERGGHSTSLPPTDRIA